MRSFFIGLVFFNLHLKIDAQEIQLARFNKLSNKIELRYTNEHGDLLGCGYTYECRRMVVVIYNILLDKKNREIKIKGRVLDPTDSSGAYAADIFIAQPYGDKLRSLRSLGMSYIRDTNDPKENNYPYRHGDFSIMFKFSSRDRLYIVHPIFKPIEYNIGKLLQ